MSTAFDNIKWFKLGVEAESFLKYPARNLDELVATYIGGKSVMAASPREMHPVNSNFQMQSSIPRAASYAGANPYMESPS